MTDFLENPGRKLNRSFEEPLMPLVSLEEPVKETDEPTKLEYLTSYGALHMKSICLPMEGVAGSRGLFVAIPCDESGSVLHPYRGYSMILCNMTMGRYWGHRLSDWFLEQERTLRDPHPIAVVAACMACPGADWQGHRLGFQRFKPGVDLEAKRDLYGAWLNNPFDFMG